MNANAPSMTPQIAAQRLHSELALLSQQLSQSAQDADAVVLDQSAMGRVSRNDALQQQAMALQMRARLQQRQRKLEAALARIAQGSFGLCCECQEPIAPARLDADLASVFCADCAEQRS